MKEKELEKLKGKRDKIIAKLSTEKDHDFWYPFGITRETLWVLEGASGDPIAEILATFVGMFFCMGTIMIDILLLPFCGLFHHRSTL